MSWNWMVSCTASLEPTAAATRSSRGSGIGTIATLGSMVVNA